MSGQGRIIAHLDMDAFFASVELLFRPDLVGQPVIIARDSARSVVVSATYEARKFGVRSAMSLAKAKSLCPQGIVVEPQQNYRAYSKQVMGILREITDAVEQVSVDEAFIDLTGAVRRLGDPVDLMQAVRERIANELGLPSSVGIGSTKFLAKMASTLSKPNGFWVVPPARVEEFLAPLPVSSLWGVGPKTAQSLSAWGIENVAQLKEVNRSALVTKFGASAGQHLYNMARGIDERRVEPVRVEKSIGAEHTFEEDTVSRADLDYWVYRLSLKVAQRLRIAGRASSSLSLKIRYSDFETLTRACPIFEPVDSAQIIHGQVMRRLEELGVVQGQVLPRAIRLIGVRAEKLDGRDAGVQESLFGGLADTPLNLNSHKWASVERAMDKIHEKYGMKGLAPAKIMQTDRPDKAGE